MLRPTLARIGRSWHLRSHGASRAGIHVSDTESAVYGTPDFASNPIGTSIFEYA